MSGSSKTPSTANGSGCTSRVPATSTSPTRKSLPGRRLTYRMQKTRRRHVLPLHDTDAAVIQRQQQHLRAAHPQWFTPDGLPLDPEMLLFRPPGVAAPTSTAPAPTTPPLW